VAGIQCLDERNGRGSACSLGTIKTQHYGLQIVKDVTGDTLKQPDEINKR